MIFLSEFVTQAEMLAGVLASQDPTAGLSSVSGTALLQIGLLLAPDASDWRLYAAQQLVNANGNDGAERILALMPAEDVFAPDSDILRAGILIRRDDDAGAVAAAERAAAHAGDRWSLIAASADIYRQANRPAEAIATYTRALSMVTEVEDRADILTYRAYANRFQGDLNAAIADVRQAYEIDQSVDTRLMYVSIMMDGNAGQWREGIQVARGLFAEQPDSVLRLNALGYALIQRPEGLEEGYRLLWRGFNFGQQDYSVVDSLGWAYYLYGHFDEARALIERANGLNVGDPNAEILDHLGDVYWRLNRRDDARAQWRAALAADPDAIRRRSLEQKLSRGLTEAAPRRRELPQVDLPDRPAQQDDL
jgi:tetratricopeptide (TPR) repeat protein